MREKKTLQEFKRHIKSIMKKKSFSCFHRGHLKSDQESFINVGQKRYALESIVYMYKKTEKEQM